MKKQILGIVAALAFGFAALPLSADVIRCDGVLGIPASRARCWCGSTRERPALGLGVAADRYGALWDRGAGRLNRYAVDGRLLASYKIPGERSSFSDAIAPAGNHLILCVDGFLHALSIDAPPGSSSTPLKIEADRMSPSSRNGWVAASKGREVFFANAAGDKKPLATLHDEPWQLEIGPDATVCVFRENKAFQIADAAGRLDPVGQMPGDRPQFLGGFLYGAGWASTLRRFDEAWQPAPGVVFGGNSGSFIGHVDEQAEIVNPRGLALVRPNLFAVSGFNGVMHLIEWHKEEKRFSPLRRIGCTATCPALALDREGRAWRLSGNWTWNDGPATPLRFGIPEPETVFGLAMQDSDSVVGYGRMWGRPTVLFGKFDKEIRINRIETPTSLPKDGVVAVAVARQNHRPALLVLEAAGAVAAVAISPMRRLPGRHRPDSIPHHNARKAVDRACRDGA